MELGDVADNLPPLLEVEGVSKRFFGVQALDAVTFSVRPGTVHAVVGQNGAGKSTLMKILMGVHKPDSGALRLEGAPYAPSGPKAAVEAGVDLVFQEIEVLGNLTIAENLFLGREPSRLGRLDLKRMFEESAQLLGRVGLDLDPGLECASLGVATRQLLQIARALRGATKLLIMDEPTSALTEHEITRLFAVIDSLRSSGLTILYVSHKLDEIFRLADWLTVLRDGKVVAHQPVEGTTKAELIHLMAGEAPTAEVLVDDAAVHPRAGEPVLQVKGLQLAQAAPRFDFELYPGEVVGLFGIVGAGRTELARALFGLDKYAAGEVVLAGEKLPPGKPVVSVQRGLGLLPEDRKQQGLILEMAVRWNASLAALPRLSPHGFVQLQREHEEIVEEVTQLDIVVADLEMEVKNLSGGNQQKVVFAKWLMIEPKVLLLDEPTKGIDVAAKADLHRRIREFAEQGLAVLLISSELDEVLAVCDRIWVLREGHLELDLPHSEATRERLLAAAVAGHAAQG